MDEELVKELLGSLRFQTFDMMDMHGNVQIHATRSLMLLCYPMAAHRIVRGINVCEVVRSSQLLGVQNRMTSDVVVV